MIEPTDIRSLTSFQRDARQSVARLRKSGRPEVLTLNGEAALVVQDARAYARLASLAEEARQAELLRQAFEESESGKTIPLAKAAAKWRRQAKAISRRARKG